MADAALFTGWGAPIRGREAKGLEVFAEAIAFWGQKQEAGEIESVDVVLLQPHGGDLNGFILAKGSAEALAAIRDSDELTRLTTRAGMVVENVGVLDGVTGDGLGESISVYEQAIGDLT